ncbi:MAG: Mrp/NBP35 family ATP-binding protein [Myxococcota bacterium]|nr:Mrp/NBP35 family ATP-binding protein [Myxococcota bacterium]
MQEKEAVIEALRAVKQPGQATDIVTGGWVIDIEFDGAETVVLLKVSGLDRTARHALEDQVTAAVSNLEGLHEVAVEIEVDDADLPAPAPAASPEPGLTMHQASAPVKQRETALSRVKNLIGVASGKGGVGKSTVTANLAMALKAKGYRVGVCDIDIYGPSMPIQLGVAAGKPGVSEDQKRFRPVEAHGISVMSIGFLVDDDTPVIWRGPIVGSVVKQFLEDVEWGALDYLVIDMPPGTGDAQLTLSQTAPLTAALIVTTPSQLALVDAQKGLQMFRKVDVPVLGFVENMSHYVCGHCGEASQPFNHGGTDTLSEKIGVDILARIPLDHGIQRGSDEGKPIVVQAPDGPQASAFLALADIVIEKCPAGTQEKKGLLKSLFGR